MILRVLFGQPVADGNGKKDPPVALESVSGDEIESSWFKKEVARWVPDADYSGFALVDIEVDEAKIRELCTIQTVPSVLMERIKR
jgi:hypothetical protein